MIFGKNILENLTTGMYKDSLVIYREYIQNACDAIDNAASLGIIADGDGQVDIDIRESKRTIVIADNATGIPSSAFRKQLENIADSDKKVGENKGFRGIGRLCGLAYCKTLYFITSFAGEAVESTMKIDAKSMRDMIAAPEKMTAEDILERVTTFSENVADKDAHYFKVVLESINEDNSDLLDVKKAKAYLSFVAPVPYGGKFLFKKKIYEFSESIGFNIDEYQIYLSGAKLTKDYTDRIYNSNGDQVDEIKDVAFQMIYGTDGKTPIAWMWFGLCKFTGAIVHSKNPMVGLRLRQGNIQLGDNRVVSKCFKEDRGNSYFVGEIHAISKGLIANSQRDYFNENSERNAFEESLTTICYNKLHDYYNVAAKCRSAINSAKKYTNAVNDGLQKVGAGFMDDKEKGQIKAQIAEAEKRKDEAKKALERFQSYAAAPDADESKSKIIRYIQEDFDKKEQAALKKAEQSQSKVDSSIDGSKKKYFTDNLSALSKKERLIVQRVLKAVVASGVDKQTVLKIQDNIIKEFNNKK